MLRKFYHRVLALAASDNAYWWLAAIAAAEASFFPIPPDALLIPMVLSRPRAAWRMAALCTAASVAGGALGYFIGLTLYEQVARPILELYHYQAAFEAFRQRFAEIGLWVILIKGLTPIPYKIVTIACGAAKFDFWLFMAASLATRGVRFFLVAGLLRVFGDPVRVFIDRQLTLVTSLLAVGIIGGFLLVRYL